MTNMIDMRDALRYAGLTYVQTRMRMDNLSLYSNSKLFEQGCKQRWREYDNMIDMCGVELDAEIIIDRDVEGNAKLSWKERNKNELPIGATCVHENMDECCQGCGHFSCPDCGIEWDDGAFGHFSEEDDPNDPEIWNEW